MADSTNTHFYDGKLREQLSPIREELCQAHAVPLSDKLDTFKCLGSRIKDKQAMTNLFIIMRDAIHNPQANYDPSNDMYAEDLLYLICGKIAVEDTAPILETQLAEVSLGMCSQGRTHRLFQVIHCIWDCYKPTAKTTA